MFKGHRAAFLTVLLIFFVVLGFCGPTQESASRFIEAINKNFGDNHLLIEVRSVDSDFLTPAEVNEIYDQYGMYERGDYIRQLGDFKIYIRAFKLNNPDLSIQAARNLMKNFPYIPKNKFSGIALMYVADYPHAIIFKAKAVNTNKITDKEIEDILRYGQYQGLEWLSLHRVGRDKDLIAGIAKSLALKAYYNSKGITDKIAEAAGTVVSGGVSERGCTGAPDGCLKRIYQAVYSGDYYTASSYIAYGEDIKTDIYILPNVYNEVDRFIMFGFDDPGKYNLLPGSDGFVITGKYYPSKYEFQKISKRFKKPLKKAMRINVLSRHQRMINGYPGPQETTTATWYSVKFDSVFSEWKYALFVVRGAGRTTSDR